MRFVRDGQALTDEWELVADEQAALPAHAIVPLARWLELAPAAGISAYGVLLRADDVQADIVAALPRCPLIAIEFASFSDGRGYSLARLVRDHGYGGDLRAVGEVLRDQVFFLTRCGFSSLTPAAQVDLEDFVRGFRDFSAVYQAAADGRITVGQMRRAR